MITLFQDTLIVPLYNTKAHPSVEGGKAYVTHASFPVSQSQIAFIAPSGVREDLRFWRSCLL
jgi:hypothetical protein